MGSGFDRAAARLLTAFDKVANSNSHLLKAPRQSGGLRDRFLSFAPSSSLKDDLCRSDLVRDWHNCHRIDDCGHWVAHEGQFYSGSSIKFSQSLTAKSFAGRLEERLISGRSFYGVRYSKDEVADIVSEFLTSFPPDRDEVLEVEPNFLHIHPRDETQDSLPEHALAFFDGHGWDYCWTWLSDDELLVLLINGSP